MGGSVPISGRVVAHQEDAEWHKLKRSHEMKADTLLKKTTAALGAAVLTVAMVACSTHRAVDTTAQTTGEIRTEAAANNNTSSGETLGTVAAPANAQGVSAPSTPAVISGPAAVDKSGNAYTSSSVGSAGNGSGTGLNTNVNIRAPKAGESSVVVTQSPATTVETVPAPVVVETTPAPAPIVVETPAPAPIVVETPAPPAPVVVETPTPAPMTSSTTTETTTKHKRMRKD
jgi:hypothetical protein